MKRISILTTLIIVIFINTNAQNKSHFDPDIYDLGLGEIISTSIIENTDSILQEFQVEVVDSGKYYLAAWVKGGINEEGEKLEYVVRVNNDNIVYKIKSKSNNSHAVVLKEKKIDLQAGINTIIFKTGKPENPNIEFIKLSLDKTKKNISDSLYTAYIDELTQHELPGDYAEIKEAAIDDENPKAVPQTEVIDTACPHCNYDYEVELDFGYSYYTTIYLYAGKTYTFETKNATSDPVLQLFKAESPSLFNTWTDDDGGYGYNSKITAYITVSGTYYLFIRKHDNPSSVVGTCNLYRNGSLYASNCAISGSSISCDKTVTETLNWFTAYLTGDSRIWIENSSGIPGKIIAYNDDFWVQPSDVFWGSASRVHANLNTSIRSVIVSASSSNNPTGNCDLYMNCKDFKDYDWYPNYNEIDAIQSAPESDAYNCASWAGGRIDLGRGFWASLDPDGPEDNHNDPWYVEDDFWLSWDNFFGNIPMRFPLAPTYTREGATYVNAEIAMWIKNRKYVHFSVAKPANDQPHGYAWESKRGEMERVFHPKNALSGLTYGEISGDYYRRVSSSEKTYTFEESLALGLTVKLTVDLTENEKSMLSGMKEEIGSKIVEEFNYKFYRLINKSRTPELKVQSNPAFLYETDEFNELLVFLKQNRNRVLPILFDMIFADNDNVSSELAAVFVGITTTEYSFLMEEVKKEWSNNNYTKEGAYIAPLPMNNTKNYIKKLLVLIDGNKADLNIETQTITENVDFDNHNQFSVYPNPVLVKTNVNFVLNKDCSVSLSVYDLSGKLVDNILLNELKGAGSYNIEWYAGNLPSGVYSFNLLAGDKVMNRKFLIE
ncbi:T9SS type A sorting domain-containing protein [Bacteroidota bacterium]